MSSLLKAALFLLITTSLATLALYDQGQVSLVWQDWILETSVSFALLIMVLGFGALYLLARLGVNLWHLPASLRQRQRMKRYGKAENAMEKGLIAIEYGDWKTAEQQLIRTAKQSDSGLMHYLSAAKMAHNQIGKVKDAQRRRQQYLEMARKHFPDDYLIIGLVEARMLSEEQPETAVLLLSELHRLNPEHKPILVELAHQLARHQLWVQLEQIWPVLFKSRALEKSEMMTLEIALQAGKLAQAKDEDQLEILWQGLNKGLQSQPEVLAEYIDQKMAWKNETGLALLIEKALSKNWSDRLVFQYGRLQLGPAYERLKKAEKWSRVHTDNPVLLLTLGRIACMSQLWGQGQAYLKKSLALKPTLETYHALAECYESEGRSEQAAVTYKQAILQLENQQ